MPVVANRLKPRRLCGALCTEASCVLIPLRLERVAALAQLALAHQDLFVHRQQCAALLLEVEKDPVHLVVVFVGGRERG